MTIIRLITTWTAQHFFAMRLAILSVGGVSAVILAVQEGGAARIPWFILALISFGSCVEGEIARRATTRSSH